MASVSPVLVLGLEGLRKPDGTGGVVRVGRTVIGIGPTNTLHGRTHSGPPAAAGLMRRDLQGRALCPAVASFHACLHACLHPGHLLGLTAWSSLPLLLIPCRSGLCSIWPPPPDIAESPPGLARLHPARLRIGGHHSPRTARRGLVRRPRRPAGGVGRQPVLIRTGRILRSGGDRQHLGRGRVARLQAAASPAAAAGAVRLSLVVGRGRSAAAGSALAPRFWASSPGRQPRQPVPRRGCRRLAPIGRRASVAA